MDSVRAYPRHHPRTISTSKGAYQVTESKMTHVDDFIWNNVKADPYVQMVLMYFRLPALQQMRWEPWLGQYKLFCIYQGEQYRVTGASRMGDIWLAKNPDQSVGYDLRVSIDDCSGWSPVSMGESTRVDEMIEE